MIFSRRAQADSFSVSFRGFAALYETRLLAVEGQIPAFEREPPAVVPAVLKPETSSFFSRVQKYWIAAQEHRRNDATMVCRSGSVSSLVVPHGTWIVRVSPPSMPIPPRFKSAPVFEKKNSWTEHQNTTF
jgi:hypothetical protein